MEFETHHVLHMKTIFPSHFSTSLYVSYLASVYLCISRIAQGKSTGPITLGSLDRNQLLLA